MDFDAMMENISKEIQIQKNKEVPWPMSSSVKLENVQQEDQVADEHSLEEEEDDLEDINTTEDMGNILKLSLQETLETLKSYMQSVIQKKDSDYFNLELQLEAELQEKENYKETAADAKKAIQKKVAQIAVLESEAEEKDHTISEHQKEIDKLKHELNASNELINKQTDHVHQLTETMKIYYQDKEDIIEKLQQEKSELEKEVKMKDEKLLDMRKLMKPLKNKISEKDIDIEDGLKKMIDLQVKIDELQVKNDVLKEKLELANSEKRSNFFVPYSAEANSLKVQLEEKNEELMRVTSENDEMQAIIEVREGEIKKMNSQNSDLIVKNSELMQEVKISDS